MADKQDTVVHIGENSPEQVALKLVQLVARLEDRSMYVGGDARNPADRKWLLDAYGECLEAVKGNRYRSWTGR